MYNYITGRVNLITPQYIVIDNNGIGYEIFVTNPYSYEIDQTVQIYTYHHLKEDEESLYGFDQIENKNLFLDLISVKGIGSKTSLGILAGTDVDTFIQAVQEKNITYLTKFPKVGKKSAQQIILDLEQKYSKINIELVDNKNRMLSNSNDELVEALLALGYDKKSISKVLKEIDQTQNTEIQIKEALKLLIKN